MKELRVVGSSDDYSYLELSDKPRAKRGSFAIPIDKDLLEVLQTALYARRDGGRRERLDAAPESAPTALAGPKVAPREIQRLLRAGMSVEKVADVLDCDEDLVERFLTPVLYERNGVIADVQRLILEKPRLGASGLNLRDSVETNLASRRIRLTDEAYLDGWDATREEGQPWNVTFTFEFRGKQVARFHFHPRTVLIEARNKAALDLGWVAKGTQKPNIPPPMPGGKRKPARKSATQRPARKTTAKRKPAPKRPARKTTAKRKPAPRRKPAAKRPARKTTARRKSAAKRPARKTTARRKPIARKAAARRPARAKTKARRSRR